MFIFYDFIFLIVVVIYLPIYLFKRKFHRGFFARLGILPKNLKLDRPIWIHAVSVGEAKAVSGLIEELRKIYPDKRFVISTVTSTGNKIALGLAKEGDFVTYLAFDLGFIVKGVIDRINPYMFIIAETEIWPNLIHYLYKKNIPIITVNGRISDNSFKGYLSIKFLLKPVLSKAKLFCLQTELDAKRLLKLGVSENKIQITGNMKFDTKIHLNKESIDYREKIRLNAQDKLFIAGSTHSGEDEIVLGAYKELLKEFGQLKLLIAPRHPQRSGTIAKIVSRFGFRSVFVSSSPLECPTCITNPVFILDVLGQLVNFYSIADIVFVGGSLIKKGGQNILEPAVLEKPVLFGPYMFNFRDIADLFLSNKAAIMVTSQEELISNIVYLLNNPTQATEMGKRAARLILQNQGATRRNAEFIRNVASV